jgi:acyl dehydratase
VSPTGSSIPADLTFGPWGAPVVVRIEPVPVALFARALKDRNPLYASPTAAAAAGLPGVVPPPTFTFVMSHGGALVDLQPVEGTGSLVPPDSGLPADGTSDSGLYLHGEQRFEYHRMPVVGDVLEGRMRVSEPFVKRGRRGEMRMTVLETRWSDAATGVPVVTEQTVSVYLPDA